MTDIPNKDIIDNRGEHTMKSHLTCRIPNIDQLDISTAYFDHKGYGLLRHETSTCIES